MSRITLIVMTPSKKLVDVQCDDVYFPSTDGILGILPDHADLVCQLGVGVLHYTSVNVTSFLKIAGGVAEVSANVVRVMADVAEGSADIDLVRAQKSLERARARLSGAPSAETDQDMARALQAEARALARIQAASKISNIL